MYRQYLRNFKKRFGRRNKDIDPEDIFLDSTNLPGFEEHRMEGRLEKPMGHGVFFFAKIFLTLIIVALVGRLWYLGINKGEVYAEISENNRLEQTLIFANRGTIYDRKARELAGNVIKGEGEDFAARRYATTSGVAHVVGYLKYPLKDKAGFYYELDYSGRDGVEKTYDNLLKGENGLKLRETDVLGNITSEAVVKKPKEGQSITLALDARVTEVMYKAIESLATNNGFEGGAGVIMDVNTGEVLALTSYPEYSQNVLTEGSDRETINALFNSTREPFLNRAVGGLYTPGSILKPVIAIAALNEKIISPNKEIFSSGSITVPNPYDPEKPSIFKDWKAHGWTAMREALAVSSDTYFYSIGGGYGDQKGLGITMLDKYFKDFGLTEKTGIELPGELNGIIPTPEWKKEKFNGDPWRLGDTYITSIGQYGTQVTPINAARFIASIANGGKILKPTLLFGDSPRIEKSIQLNALDVEVVREGMREAVTYGTAVGLNVPYVEAAAKTGTAEVGSAKKYVNSWSVGFFPYNNPKYAWAVVMEKGPSTNTLGATSIMRQVLDWISVYSPEYLR